MTHIWNFKAKRVLNTAYFFCPWWSWKVNLSFNSAVTWHYPCVHLQWPCRGREMLMWGHSSNCSHNHGCLEDRQACSSAQSQAARITSCFLLDHWTWGCCNNQVPCKWFYVLTPQSLQAKSTSVKENHTHMLRVQGHPILSHFTVQSQIQTYNPNLLYLYMLWVHNILFLEMEGEFKSLMLYSSSRHIF